MYVIIAQRSNKKVKSFWKYTEQIMARSPTIESQDKPSSWLERGTGASLMDKQGLHKLFRLLGKILVPLSNLAAAYLCTFAC